jgi:hypothetical protein
MSPRTLRPASQLSFDDLCKSRSIYTNWAVSRFTGNSVWGEKQVSEYAVIRPIGCCEYAPYFWNRENPVNWLARMQELVWTSKNEVFTIHTPSAVISAAVSEESGTAPGLDGPVRPGQPLSGRW